MRWGSKKQQLDLLCDLIRIPSITGTNAEIELPKFVVEQLNHLPYFQSHPDHLELVPTGDGRYFVTALVKRNPSVQNTIVLISHFDVVDVTDYGTWMEYAFQAEELTRRFYAQDAEIPKDLKEEIHQGNWLFGRGSMDMKCGLASHMVMIEKAAQGEFEGNILLLTVPDEEVNSVGMRAAVPYLHQLAQRHDLSYQTIINSESVFSNHPGETDPFIYTGTIGKILPGFLCYGKETHVGEPLSGLNANFMVSQLTSQIELNTDFCEQVGDYITPPPTNQYQRDQKEDYSVQIPHRAVTLFNLFVLERKMEDWVSSLLEVARKAAHEIEQSYLKRGREFSQYRPFTSSDWQVQVLSFSELLDYARRTHGEGSIRQIEERVRSQSEGKDERRLTMEWVDELAILCKELSPMIVLFFAPPFYPAVSSRHHPLIQQVTEEMIAYARDQHQINLKKQAYYGGISDLSYVGLPYSSSFLQPLVQNMPLWEKGYSIPLQAIEELKVPVLNLGPYGKGLHQWTERLDIDYSFDVFMDMLPVCIHTIFSLQERNQ